MIYFIIGLYLFVLAYLYDVKLYKYNFKVNYYISLIILVLIAGFRYRMAPDSVVYLNDYLYRTSTLSDLKVTSFTLSRYQPLWIILNSFCKTISKDFVLMQLVSAFILNASVFYFFRKLTSKVFSCILFYYISSYLYFNMEIMRESLAIAMFLLAMLNFNKGKYLKCILFLFIATQFHSFSILLSLVFIFLIERIPQWIKNVIAIIILLTFIFVPNLQNLIGIYLGGSMGDSLSFYKDVQLGQISIIGYIYMLIRVLIILIVINKIKKLETIPFTNFNRKLIYNISIIYIILIVIRTISIPFLERVLNYFILLIILLLTSYLFYYIKNKRIKKMKSSLFLGAVFVSLFFNIYPMFKYIPEWKSRFYRRYYPYNSVFEKEKNSEREYINYIEGKDY